MKNIMQSLRIVTLAVVLSFGISYVYAWTAPTATPPGGNVYAPINTSTTPQSKEGSFGVYGLLRGYGSAIFDGKVGIGTTNPLDVLHVAGGPDGISGHGIVIEDKNAGGGRWMLQSANSLSGIPGFFVIANWFDNTSPIRLMVSPTGDVGIGTNTSLPATKLDVAGGIRPGPAVAGNTCSPIGAQAYNSSTGAPLYCNGSVWTAVGGGGLGVGQTWQNVTASRACGEGYTNSTGKPIMANIYVGNTAAQGFPFFNAYVDGVLVSTFNLRSWGANGGSNVGSSVNFVVPNGSSYNCARSGDATVYSWTELR